MKKKIFAFATMLSFLFLIMAGYLSHVSGEEKERENIRPPAVAGTFYPGSPAKLRKPITELLDSVPQVTPAGEILAAVAPHAGYTYSDPLRKPDAEELPDTLRRDSRCRGQQNRFRVGQCGHVLLPALRDGP